VELKFIGDRSSILGTIITPSGITRKNALKLLKKLRENRVVFCTVSVFIVLKFFRVVDWGGMAPSTSSPTWLRTVKIPNEE